MRSRNIKPGFFKNEQLGEVSPLARILFTGLWCMADREGFLEYRPKRIKIELLPYDSEDVEKLLDELRSCSAIDFFYFADGRAGGTPSHIHVRNFKKHQNPHKQEKSSEIIELVEDQEITRQVPNNNGTTSEVVGLIPDSLNLIPDPLPSKEEVVNSTPQARRFQTETGEWIDADTGEQLTPFDGGDYAPA